MQIGDRVYVPAYLSIVGILIAIERPSWAEEPWVSIRADDGFTYQERQSKVKLCEKESS